jgi:Tfp pilus assembly protein PilO
LASAMAVVLLIIILLVTFIQKAAFKYFFGEGEQEAIRTVRKRKKLAKKELSVNLNREVSRNVSGKA